MDKNYLKSVNICNVSLKKRTYINCLLVFTLNYITSDYLKKALIPPT